MMNSFEICEEELLSDTELQQDPEDDASTIMPKTASTNTNATAQQHFSFSSTTAGASSSTIKAEYGMSSGAPAARFSFLNEKMNDDDPSSSSSPTRRGRQVDESEQKMDDGSKNDEHASTKQKNNDSKASSTIMTTEDTSSPKTKRNVPNNEGGAGDEAKSNVAKVPNTSSLAAVTTTTSTNKDCEEDDFLKSSTLLLDTSQRAQLDSVMTIETSNKAGAAGGNGSKASATTSIYRKRSLHEAANDIMKEGSNCNSSNSNDKRMKDTNGLKKSNYSFELPYGSPRQHDNSNSTRNQDHQHHHTTGSSRTASTPITSRTVTTEATASAIAEVANRVISMPPRGHGEYDICVPVCREGLMVNIGHLKGDSAQQGPFVFLGYRRFTNNGQQGPAEIKKLFRRPLDRILTIDGISLHNKTHTEVHNILRAGISRSVVYFRVIDAAIYMSWLNHHHAGGPTNSMPVGAPTHQHPHAHPPPPPPFPQSHPHVHAPPPPPNYAAASHHPQPPPPPPRPSPYHHPYVVSPSRPPPLPSPAITQSSHTQMVHRDTAGATSNGSGKYALAPPMGGSSLAATATAETPSYLLPIAPNPNQVNGSGTQYQYSKRGRARGAYTSWEERFVQLLEYRKARGDFSIPKDEGEHLLALARWVVQQRHSSAKKLRSKRELAPYHKNRLIKLISIGIVPPQGFLKDVPLRTLSPKDIDELLENAKGEAKNAYWRKQLQDEQSSSFSSPERENKQDHRHPQTNDDNTNVKQNERHENEDDDDDDEDISEEENEQNEEEHNKNGLSNCMQASYVVLGDGDALDNIKYKASGATSSTKPQSDENRGQIILEKNKSMLSLVGTKMLEAKEDLSTDDEESTIENDETEDDDNDDDDDNRLRKVASATSSLKAESVKSKESNEKDGNHLLPSKGSRKELFVNTDFDDETYDDEDTTTEDESSDIDTNDNNSTNKNKNNKRTRTGGRKSWVSSFGGKHWQNEEDDILLRNTHLVGKWTELAKMLAGRSPSSVRNHWKSLARRIAAGTVQWPSDMKEIPDIPPEHMFKPKKRIRSKSSKKRPSSTSTNVGSNQKQK